MKNSNDTIGYRGRGLPGCSAMPQPTASPSAPYRSHNGPKIDGNYHGSIILLCMMEYCIKTSKTKLNSVALVRERTIPTERPPPVGEVSANFC